MSRAAYPVCAKPNLGSLYQTLVFWDTYVEQPTGDKIDVSSFDADATVAGHQAWTVTFDAVAVSGTTASATVGTDGISTGTDHTIVAQRGVWDATGGDFTHTAAGSDTLLVFDDGTNVGYAVVDARVLVEGDFILT